MNQEEARTKALEMLKLYESKITKGQRRNVVRSKEAIVNILLREDGPDAYRKITEDIERYANAIAKWISVPIAPLTFFNNYAYHEKYIFNVDSIGRKCIVCGKLANGHITCSSRCLTTYRRESKKKGKPRLAVCPVCGRTFVANEYNYRGRKYCSAVCQHTARLQRKRKGNQKRREKQKKDNPHLQRTCRICGKIYYESRKTKAGRVYCSEECRSIAHEKICACCGKPFRAEKPDYRYCSRSCSAEGARIFSNKSAIKQGKEEKEKAKTAEYHDRESKKWVGVGEIYDAYTKRIRPLPKGWFKYEITPLIKRILDKGYAVGDLMDAISKYELEIQNGDNIREPHHIFFGKEWMMYREYLSSDSIRRAKELRKKGEENNSSPMPEVKLPPKEDKSMKGANEEPQPNIIESEPQPSLLEALIKEFENASLKEKLEFTSHLLPQYSDDGNTELIDAYLEAYPDNPLRHIKEDDTVIHILYGEATVIDVTDSEITVLAMSAGKHSIVDTVQRNGIKIDGSRLQRMLYADIDDLQDFIKTESIKAIGVPVEHWLYCLKNLVEQDKPAKEK